MLKPRDGSRKGLKRAAVAALAIMLVGVLAVGIQAQQQNSAAQIAQALKDLRDSSSYVRRDAVRALAELGAKTYAGEVARMLKDENEEVQTWAIIGLTKFGAKEYVGSLALLLKDEKPGVRGYAVRALADLGARPYAAEIARLLTDGTAYIRSDSARALAKLGAREQAPAIARLLTYSDGDVRKAAVQSLQKMDYQPSVSDVFKIASGAVVRIETQCENGTATGAGFVVSVDGRVATNRHVIRPSAKEGLGAVERVIVFFQDGRSFAVDKSWIHPRYDLALVQIQNPPQGLFYLHFADDLPLVGEDLVIIGHPVGLDWSLSSGKVSQIRDDPDGGKQVWIQTDGTINPGNSGGPMLSRYAQVIGVATKSLVVFGDESLTGLHFGVSAGVARQFIFYGR